MTTPVTTKPVGTKRVVLKPGAKGPVNLSCKVTTLSQMIFRYYKTVRRQVNCLAQVSASLKAPDGVCIQIQCTNIAPPPPCTANPTADCSWNIGPTCGATQPTYPGSTWAFGLITSVQGPIEFAVGPYELAQTENCTVQ